MSGQERKIVHLEISGEHHYFGNLKALCENWDKDKIGVTYAILRNYNITGDKPFRNDKCVIRRGTIITSARSVKKSDKTSI